MSRVHLSPPDVGAAEEAALVRAIRSGWVAPLGPEVDAFEAELAAVCDRAHCVVLSSGTAALHLGLLTLGVRPGDVVVTSSLTFAATANAICYTGARPVFVDCGEDGNLDPGLLEEALTDQRSRGNRVAAVVPVDLLGKVVRHDEIDRLAADHGAPVLCDAAESLGARAGGRSAASFGAAAAVSFNGNKIITTSGGGALLTDDAEQAGRVRYLATQARQPVAHYEHTEVGFNYRMSNLLAALGRAQLARLDELMARLADHRRFYRALVADLPGVRVLGEPSGLDDPDNHDNWWLTSLLIDPEAAGFDSAALIAALGAQDIEARPLWKPMHRQPVFSGATAYVSGVADRLFATGVSLPSGSVLTDHDRERVADIVRAVARA